MEDEQGGPLPPGQGSHPADNSTPHDEEEEGDSDDSDDSDDSGEPRQTKTKTARKTASKSVTTNTKKRASSGGGEAAPGRAGSLTVAMLRKDPKALWVLCQACE